MTLTLFVITDYYLDKTTFHFEFRADFWMRPSGRYIGIRCFVVAHHYCSKLVNWNSRKYDQLLSVVFDVFKNLPKIQGVLLNMRWPFCNMNHSGSTLIRKVSLIDFTNLDIDCRVVINFLSSWMIIYIDIKTTELKGYDPSNKLQLRIPHLREELSKV